MQLHSALWEKTANQGENEITDEEDNYTGAIHMLSHLSRSANVMKLL